MRSVRHDKLAFGKPSGNQLRRPRGSAKFHIASFNLVIFNDVDIRTVRIVHDGGRQNGGNRFSDFMGEFNRHCVIRDQPAGFVLETAVNLNRVGPLVRLVIDELDGSVFIIVIAVRKTDTDQRLLFSCSSLPPNILA